MIFLIKVKLNFKIFVIYYVKISRFLKKRKGVQLLINVILSRLSLREVIFDRYNLESFYHHFLENPFIYKLLWGYVRGRDINISLARGS